MSHAKGQVRFEDGTVMHFEYDGTCDISINCLYSTSEEVDRNWRCHEVKKCQCGCDGNVEIATNYGNGSSWHGKACRICRAITYEDRFIRKDRLPEWWLGTR